MKIKAGILIPGIEFPRIFKLLELTPKIRREEEGIMSPDSTMRRDGTSELRRGGVLLD
jgi:hypothetical protein